MNETEQTKDIAVIMEKLNNMHDTLNDVKKAVKETNGKVANNLRDIALIKQDQPNYLKKGNLNPILWKYVTGSVTTTLGIISVFGFVFKGYFENTIQESISKNLDREGLEEDISSSVVRYIKDNYEITIE